VFIKTKPTTSQLVLALHVVFIKTKPTTSQLVLVLLSARGLF
jgi:hypothetical protein